MNFLSKIALAASLAVPAFAQQTIADIVVEASGGSEAGTFDENGRDYDILINALQTANLVGAVADPAAELTVFAPNDRAFHRLANDLGFQGGSEEDAWNFLVGALTTLGNGDPVPVLTDILLYHVVPEEVTAFQLIIKSFFGQTIATALTNATIRPFFFTLIDNDPDFRNPFLVRPINLTADNGIIHGVSRVLIPVDLP